jgi:hypothetical protein
MDKKNVRDRRQKMLSDLPLDVAARVCQFLDLSSLVKLSQCSSTQHVWCGQTDSLGDLDVLWLPFLKRVCEKQKARGGPVGFTQVARFGFDFRKYNGLFQSESHFASLHLKDIQFLSTICEQSWFSLEKIELSNPPFALLQEFQLSTFSPIRLKGFSLKHPNVPINLCDYYITNLALHSWELHSPLLAKPQPQLHTLALDNIEDPTPLALLKYLPNLEKGHFHFSPRFTEADRITPRRAWTELNPEEMMEVVLPRLNHLALRLDMACELKGFGRDIVSFLWETLLFVCTRNNTLQSLSIANAPKRSMNWTETVPLFHSLTELLVELPRSKDTADGPSVAYSYKQLFSRMPRLQHLKMGNPWGSPGKVTKWILDPYIIPLFIRPESLFAQRLVKITLEAPLTGLLTRLIETSKKVHPQLQWVFV